MWEVIDYHKVKLQSTCHRQSLVSGYEKMIRLPWPGGIRTWRFSESCRIDGEVWHMVPREGGLCPVGFVSRTHWRLLGLFLGALKVGRLWDTKWNQDIVLVSSLFNLQPMQEALLLMYQYAGTRDGFQMGRPPTRATVQLLRGSSRVDLLSWQKFHYVTRIS